MEAVRIRQVTSSDLAQLQALDHSSSTEHVWQLELRREPRGQEVTALFREVRLPRPVRLRYPNDPVRLADNWKRKALLIAAAAGAEVVGYLALTLPRDGVGWVTDVVVAPRWRRRGVAMALLEQAHQWCIERGLDKVFLEMQSKNHPAIAMAQKLGYEFCGYNDQYYPGKEVALLFVRATR